jgi:hypothetical protein
LVIQGDFLIIDKVTIDKKESWKLRSVLKQLDYKIDKNLLDCGSGF